MPFTGVRHYLKCRKITDPQAIQHIADHDLNSLIDKAWNEWRLSENFFSVHNATKGRSLQFEVLGLKARPASVDQAGNLQSESASEVTPL